MVLLTQKKHRKKNRSVAYAKLAFFLFVILTVSALIYFILFKSTYFVVKDIRVEGLDNINEEEIIQLSGIHYEDQLFDLKLSKIEVNIEQHPYVREAEVTRKNVKTINIVVREREEYAIIPYMGSYVTLDEEKVVLKVSDGILVNNLCLVTGIEFISFTIGDKVQAENMKSLDAAYLVLGAAKEADILDLISEINIDQNGQVKIITFNGIEALLGHLENPAYSVLALKEALITLHTRNMRDVILDMRYEGHMTVRNRSRQEVEDD